MAMLDEYQSFSECVQGQVQNSGFDGAEISMRVAESGLAPRLIGEAKRLLPKNDAFLKSIDNPDFPLDQKLQLTMAALVDVSRMSESTRVQRMVALYLDWKIISNAFPGTCHISDKFSKLLGKATR